MTTNGIGRKVLAHELLDCLPPDVDPGNSLSVLMLRGWFNDQRACAERFLAGLDASIRDSWTVNPEHRDMLKQHYRNVSSSFEELATRGEGEHKRFEQLGYSHFAWWVGCVFRACGKAGSLGELIGSLRTVEDAHSAFRSWFVPGGHVKRPRILNAADAARLLARAGQLRREERPLLAAGALRGAAIAVDARSVRSTKHAEALYPDETSRHALEERAALFAKQRWGDDVPMDAAETWFCNAIHKGSK